MVLLLITRLFAYKIDQNCYYSLHIVCMQKGPAIMQAIPILLIPPHHMYVRTYSPSRYVSYNKQLKKYEHEQQQQQLQHCDANSKIKIHTHTPLWEKKTWISSESWQNKNKCKGREPRRESIFTSRAFLNASKCVSCAILNACQHFLAFSATLSCFSRLLSLSLREQRTLCALFFGSTSSGVSNCCTFVDTFFASRDVSTGLEK